MQLCVQKCVQMNRRPWKEDTQNGNNRKSLNCKMVWSVGCKVVKSNLSFEHTWPSMFRWLSDTKCSGNLYLKSSFVQCGYPNKNFQIGLEIKILIFALCVRSRSIPKSIEERGHPYRMRSSSVLPTSIRMKSNAIWRCVHECISD